MNDTAALSMAALHHAQSLVEADTALLAACLYNFNRHPISPYWKHAYPDQDAILQALELQPGGSNDLLLSQDWRPAPIQGNSWIGWGRKGRSNAAKELPIKLYISCTCEVFPSAFQAALPALAKSQAAFFKIGKGAGGLLRPDKWVAYFSCLEDLCEAAREIRCAISGTTAQTVPFTCQLDTEALLSWAQPPPVPMLFSNGRPASWRQWICLVAAEAIAAHWAATQPIGEAWQAATRQLGELGIDTQAWAISGAQTISI